MNADQIAEARKRFEQIADIIDRNLYHQREKVADAKAIALAGAAAIATMPQPVAGDIEAQAWNCDQWPEWLHRIVNETNNVADRLDMSSEQAHAYAVLLALTTLAQGALPSEEDDLRAAARNIVPYLMWAIGEESPGHHPTMPSAVSAFMAAFGWGTDEKWQEDRIDALRNERRRAGGAA